MRATNSLQFRLAIRLSLLFIAATTIIVTVFVFKSYKAYDAQAALAHHTSETFNGRIIDSLLREFFSDAGWIMMALVGIAVVIGVLAVRNGLKPVRDISQIAAQIGPGNTSIRLPTHEVPSEIAPMVNAINFALDRLESGFILQKQFTANAAHELRTPLAIVTSALETANTVDELESVKADVARMNRLVEQLLKVARLDDVGLNATIPVDLNDIAAKTIAMMAPRAIAAHRHLALNAAAQPVMINGNATAIEDALRNLIDNAISYSPAHSEIVIAVTTENQINVIDRGSGVTAQDKAVLFQRFARGQHAQPGGVGLGLAIVRSIMQLHNGTAGVTDNPGGGAIFSLTFPTPN